MLNPIILFQSTPPHGERLRRVTMLNPIILFQSTPPHGERLVDLAVAFALLCVSIHAPARGATGCWPQ